MKIALAQLNYIVGHFDYNAGIIIENINKAKRQGADLVVFSELSVCGYMPNDLLEQHDFIEKCQLTLNYIASHCYGIVAIVGAPVINRNPKGKKLYNAACVLNNGKIETQRFKSLLPTYDIFDEYRYFEPNHEWQIVEIKGERIALTICEDIWDKQPIAYVGAKGELYQSSPLEYLSRQNPEIIVNIAASPFSYNQGNIRRQVLSENARRYELPLVYVNQTGANTELVFDGDSCVLNKNGESIVNLGVFKEGFEIIDTNILAKDGYKPIPEKEPDYIEKIHDALVMGIHDYFSKMGFKKATLGLSGGIDSAVTLALAASALGAENLYVLLMPSKYSSDHSITDALVLANNLGVKHEIISIQPVADAFDSSLAKLFTGQKADITEENIQARVRGTLLMALSNKFGNILLNTSNKSEAAVGYGTLYGDMNGGLSVLGDVYKTDVYKLAHYINRNTEIIPLNSIIKPPSAELRPDQKDSDSLPEYDLLDAILFRYIEQKLSASEIIAQGYQAEIVEKVLRLVNMNEYKRFQAPPIIRVSSKSFGFGRRMPLVAKF
jgi:NAD+ synthase (glutamine-hydrolysing)